MHAHVLAHVVHTGIIMSALVRPTCRSTHFKCKINRQICVGIDGFKNSHR